MDIFRKILDSIPFFRHCTDEEVGYLRSMARETKVKPGQEIDLKMVNSLNIIVDGVFESGARGKNEMLYLTAGSFFGEIPFIESKNRGIIRAVTDARLIHFEMEDLYKFFFAFFKAFRGYIKAAGRLGLGLTDAGGSYLGKNCSVITVYGAQSPSGKTVFAGYLARSLSTHGKTIILDMSYEGDTVFNIFGKKITPALSQKQPDQSGEVFINDREEIVDDNLSLLNIAHGSKVMMDAGILSPILLILSRKFQYIVIDLSDADHDLRDKTFDLSDTVYAMITRPSAREPLFDLFDSVMKQGQRVYYILNRHYSERFKMFEGGYLFENLGPGGESGIISAIDSAISGAGNPDFIKAVISKKRGIVAESNLFESAAVAGLLFSLQKAGLDADMFYSSAYSYSVISIFLQGKNPEGIKNDIGSFFSEAASNGFLEITFPEEHIFKSGKAGKFAGDIARDRRIEFFKSLPVLMASDRSHSKRIFSTGYLKDLMTASMLLYPVFEPVRIAGGEYFSGFPGRRVAAEDLFRYDIDEIYYASVNFKNPLSALTDRTIGFYKRYIDSLYDTGPGHQPVPAVDMYIDIDITEKKFDVQKIIDLSGAAVEKCLEDAQRKQERGTL